MMKSVALLQAPHRMLFFIGALQLIAVMAFWSIELIARAGNLPFPYSPTVPAAWAHAFLMLYGLFPFFIFGFLLTVYPRWMNEKPVMLLPVRAIALLLFTGVAAFYLGLFFSRTLAGFAVIVMLTGWALAFITLWQVYRRATRHGIHENLINIALAAGFCGMAFFLASILRNHDFSFLIARELGIWLFLVPVVFSVSHRMIPFFSQIVLENYEMVRPAWSPPLVMICAAGHALLSIGGQPQWLSLFDVPMTIIAIHHSVVWKLKRSFAVPLLAMLHLAFLWLALAMALYSLQSLALAIFGWPVLGRAPLHALGIGFLTGMVVAMATRVTLGHSGRPLTADRYSWWLFLGVHLTAATRIGAEIVPAATAGNLIAAFAWLAFLFAWVRRYAPLYLKPRADGKPG